MEKLTKEIVVHTWFFSGLKDLFFAFQIDSPFHYEPFLNALGFEKICKAYLLAENSSKYENLEEYEAMKKIDSLVKAKNWGHNLECMVNKIKKGISDQKLENMINQNFDGYTGNRLIEVMQAAYLECRYPGLSHIHEKFPIKGFDLICSTGIQKFCFAFTCKIMIHIKGKFNISIPKREFYQVIAGEAGRRFCNLFLKNLPDDYFKLNL